MAGKSKNMSQIKQLLLLKKSGVSNRKAADIIGMNKETVNKYMNKVSADSLTLDELIRLDDPILEHRLKGGNPAYSDKLFETFKTASSISSRGDEAQTCHAEAALGGIP